jgi:hypothetical protein
VVTADDLGQPPHITELHLVTFFRESHEDGLMVHTAAEDVEVLRVACDPGVVPHGPSTAQEIGYARFVQGVQGRGVESFGRGVVGVRCAHAP